MRSSCRFCATLVLALSVALCGCGKAVETNDGSQAREVEEVSTETAEPLAEEEPEKDAEEPAETDAVTTTEYACITVTMPSRYEEMGLAWIEYEQALRLEYAYNGDRVLLAEVDWDERAAIPYEIKEERWDVGKVTYQDSVADAVMHVPYVDADGKTFYGGLEVDGAVLAPEYYLGLSPIEIRSWLHTNVGEIPVSAREDGLSTRTIEFYGVWAYASKDLGEAIAFANDARGRGFDAEVFLTTDWENLNPEPWFVVSLGCAQTEAAAVGILENALYLPAGGYDDAYIKFSGAYVG